MNLNKHLCLTCLLAAMLFSTTSIRAEYITNTKTVERSISSGSSFIDRQIAGAIDKAIDKLKDKIPGLLKNLAKAILDVYAAQLSGLLFGGSGQSLEQAVERLIDEIQQTERILSDQISEVLDEVQDQFQGSFETRYNQPIRAIKIWLLNDNLDQRFASREVLRSAAESLGVVQDGIRAYIALEAESERSQVRRLQLLTLQLSAAQMEAVAWRYYYGIIASEDAFRDAGLSNMDRFDDWVTSLSDAEQNEILSGHTQLQGINREVFEPIFPFYEATSSQEYYKKYIESVTSPIVWQSTQFSGALQRYEDTEVLQDASSWDGPIYDIVWIEGPAGSTSTLDGIRWYYYVDIPDSTCLDPDTGPKWEALDTSVWPWSEDREDASLSECNRFWFVSPNLVRAPGPPASFVGSFDQYRAWFDNPERAVELHQSLIVGDLLTDLYGPISLILDQTYFDLNGNIRPRNEWDRKLDSYRLNVAMLAATRETLQYIDFDVLVSSANRLNSFGASFDLFTTDEWVDLLTQFLLDNDTMLAAIALMTEVFHTENWLSPAFDDTRQQKVPPVFVRETLVGDRSIFSRLKNGENAEALRSEYQIIVRNYTVALYSAL